MIDLKTKNTNLRKDVTFLMDQNAKLINLMNHLSRELKNLTETVSRNAESNGISSATFDEYARDISKIGCGRGIMAILKVC